jgi:hypothetical protein
VRRYGVVNIEIISCKYLHNHVLKSGVELSTYQIQLPTIYFHHGHCWLGLCMAREATVADVQREFDSL